MTITPFFPRIWNSRTFNANVPKSEFLLWQHARFSFKRMTWMDSVAVSGFFLDFFRLSFYVSALIVDNARKQKKRHQRQKRRRTNEWPQWRRGGGGSPGPVLRGWRVLPVAGVERLTRCTAAKRTVDHVWRRLPVNARDELAIGAGGATGALKKTLV